MCDCTTFCDVNWHTCVVVGSGEADLAADEGLCACFFFFCHQMWTLGICCCVLGEAGWLHAAAYNSERVSS